MDPHTPDNAFDSPCAISSRSTSTLSMPVDTPSAGTLMGTWRMPKKVSANIAGTVFRSAVQFTAWKSVLRKHREGTGEVGSYRKEYRNAKTAPPKLAHQIPTPFRVACGFQDLELPQRGCGR